MIQPSNSNFNSGEQNVSNKPKNSKGTESSFFEKVSPEEIFSKWNNSNTILDLAKSLGFKGEHLTRADYNYIEKLKNQTVWREHVVQQNRKKERERYQYIAHLKKTELESIMNSPGIQTLSHLAFHFLVSPKHGRKKLRQLIQKLGITNIKTSLHKGIIGVSPTPIFYPASAYEKRVGEKPSVCPVCQFVATSAQQIELHHPTNIDSGTKRQRSKDYYRTMVTPICANCHSLEHRTGEHLFENCGLWHRKPFSKNRKYANPSDIFNSNCTETYRLQKTYYIQWHLKSSSEYKCSECGVTYWGPENKLLTLELHHIDATHRNSNLENLQLLCPNCHRAKRES